MRLQICEAGWCGFSSEDELADVRPELRERVRPHPAQHSQPYARATLPTERSLSGRQVLASALLLDGLSLVNCDGCKRLQQRQRACRTHRGTYLQKKIRMRGSPCWNAGQDIGSSVRQPRPARVGSSGLSRAECDHHARTRRGRSTRSWVLGQTTKESAKLSDQQLSEYLLRPILSCAAINRAT